MNFLYRIEDAIFRPIGRFLDVAVMSTLARLIFAATLLMFFWNSGLTKLGQGLIGLIQPDPGAYVQMLPKAMEAVGYDPSQLSLFHKLVVMAGTWGEFLLPAMVVLGLFTRAASLGMIVFIGVMTYVDIYGHGATIGRWFDNLPYDNIVDQRLFWLFLLLYLVMRGAGPLSVDGFMGRRSARQDPLTSDMAWEP